MSDPAARPDLSMVVPCYAEEATLPELHARLVRVLDPLAIDYEIVLVDDGSPDKTRQVMRELRGRDPRVRWIGLSRNFGHQAALTAGLTAARGHHVVSMDADLQHPPELVPRLLDTARAGYEVVLTVREADPSAPLLKRISSRSFYWLLGRVAKLRVDAGSSDFRLLSRRALDALLSLPERHRFLRGMVAWSGFSTARVAFRAEPRAAGQGAYTLGRMLRFAADALFSFTTLPLRLAVLFGVCVVLVSGLYGLYAIYARLFLDAAVPGWTSLLITVLFLGGVQLLTLGIVGEYVARVYDEVKRRPLYLEDEREGFDGAE